MLLFIVWGLKKNWHHFGLFLSLFSTFHLNFLQLCKKLPSYISGTHLLLFPLVNNGQKWCQKLCNIFSSLHLLQGESVTQSIGPNCIYLFQLLESSQIYAIIFHPPLFHDLENSDYCTTVQVYVQRTALPCTRCVRALYSISSSRKHSTSISSAAGLQSGCC